MSPSVTVPSTPLLEAAELEATLRCALRCELSALQSLSCGGETTGGSADGFLSKCGGMRVDAVVGGRGHKLHLFVKRADAMDVVESMDSFGREALFYRTVEPLLETSWRRHDNQKQEQWLPDLGPATYLATDDVVVMEDLTHLGYKGPPADWVVKGMDFSSVQQVLRAMARLHAASLLAERLDGVSFATAAPDLLNEHFLTRKPGAIGRRIFDCAADLTCDLVLPCLQPRLKVPQTERELQRLCDKIRDIFCSMDADKLRTRDPSGVMVVSHGDAWPNNVLFKFDDQGRVEHAVLVDFQTARLAPPAFDVAMYLVNTLRRDFRELHQDALLRGYHDDLTRFTKERGLDISEEYDWEAFLASWRQMLPTIRAIGLAYRQINSGKADDMATLFQDGEARARFLLESKARAVPVARWLDNEEYYRKIQQEYAEDLLELPAGQATE